MTRKEAILDILSGDCRDEFLDFIGRDNPQLLSDLGISKSSAIPDKQKLLQGKTEQGKTKRCRRSK